MGAGDVKLMAMTGAFLGGRGMMGAFMYILLAGGLLALVMAWRQGRLSTLLRKLKMGPFTMGSSAELTQEEPAQRQIPFAQPQIFGSALQILTSCLMG